MSTHVDFGLYNTISGIQVGDGNSMVNIIQPTPQTIWSELESHLKNEIFSENRLSSHEVATLNNLKNIVNEKKENKLMDFIRDNKNSFIVNTLSALASEVLKTFLFI